MSRRTCTAGATFGVAGAIAAVIALSGTAQALPPEVRSITMNCVELTTGTNAIWGGNAALTSTDPGAPYKQRMKVITSNTGALFPPNTITTTVRTEELSGTVWDFTGKVNPPGLPQMFGPLSASSRLPAGTTVHLKNTYGTPTATNWSLRMYTTLSGGYAYDVACTGSQVNWLDSFTF